MPDVSCIVQKTVKLSEPTRKIQLQEPLAYDNALAHSMVAAIVNDDGTPANVTGLNVVASFMRADGNTVTPINGTFEGSYAIVVLPASCYVSSGRFKFTMNLRSPTPTDGIDAFSSSTAYDKGALVAYSGVVYRFTSAHAAGAWTGEDATPDGAFRTILWVEGYVEKNVSGTIIDPGTPVGNITQAIGSAEAAATSATSAASAALEAAGEASAYSDSVAPDYDDITYPIAIGRQVCWHEGALYVNTANIAESEVWDSDHWEETDISKELNKRLDPVYDVATVAETKTYLGIV